MISMSGPRAFESAGNPTASISGVTRIGVHAGPALVGNFGGSRFFDYTAYGDTINTAARLEAANKHLGTRICVSASAAEYAERFRGRPVGDLMLRGRSEPLRAFEPLASERFEAPETAQYSEAFAKLEAGDPAAMPAFAALVGLHADDALAGFHLRRGCSTAPRASRMQMEYDGSLAERGDPMKRREFIGSLAAATLLGVSGRASPDSGPDLSSRHLPSGGADDRRQSVRPDYHQGDGQARLHTRPESGIRGSQFAGRQFEKFRLCCRS